MKFRFIMYAILAMAFQVILGQLTGQGQGSIGVLAFLIMVEIDPNFSFAYLVQKIEKDKDSE